MNQTSDIQPLFMNIDSIALWTKVGAIATQLPEVEAGTSYGTPAFKVKGKLFARLKEDGKTLVIYTNERDKWMKQNPRIFFITDHYLNYPNMLVDIAAVSQKDLKTLLSASWQIKAPKKF